MTIRTLKWTSAAAFGALAMTLSGCGGVDGVELNGKVFDMMGISPSAQKNANREERLPNRTGLIMPPDANRLPEPGSGQEPDIAANLNDPDRKKELAAAERARLHKAYCTGDLTWKERVLKPGGSNTPQSPFGPCTTIGAIINSK